MLFCFELFLRFDNLGKRKSARDDRADFFSFNSFDQIFKNTFIENCATEQT